MSRLRWLAWMGCVMWVVGCQHPVSVPSVPSEFALSPYGEVVYVRMSYRYVIVKSPALLEEGEEWSLFRDGARVGRVRVARLHADDYWVADVLDGTPEVGDLLKP